MHSKSQLSSFHYYKVAALAVVLGLIVGPFYAAYDMLLQSYACIGAVWKWIASQCRQSQWNTRGFLQKLPQHVDLTSSMLEKEIRPQSPAKRHVMHEAVSDYIFELAKTHEQQYYLGRASFISSITVMYAMTKRYEVAQGIVTQYHGQVCRADLSTGRLYVSLHAADAKTVVDAGWGRFDVQRAMPAWCESILRHGSGRWVLMKLPSKEDELDIIKTIINAAAWWVGETDSGNADVSLV